jgi:hypothetical protein
MLRRVAAVLIIVGLTLLVCIEFPWVMLLPEPAATVKEQQERDAEYESYRVKKYAGRIMLAGGCVAWGLHCYTSRRKNANEHVSDERAE